MPTFIAIDIETSGLYPVSGSKIYCIAVNTGKSIQVYEDAHKVKAVLEDKSIVKVIHNATFDCFWLKRIWGVNITNIWDTRLMEQVLIGENLPRSNKDEKLREQLSSSLVYTLKRYGLAELEGKKGGQNIGAKFATRSKYAPLSKEEIDYAKNDVKW